MTPLLHVVVAGRNNAQWVERHCEGLLAQTGCVWRCTWIDDASDDGTVEKAEILRSALQVRVQANPSRLGGVRNLTSAIHTATTGDEVIVLWDADDFFAHEGALARIAQEFADPDVWLTYGGFRTWPAGRALYSGAYPADVIAANTFRSHSWLCAPPRAFRAWLFKLLDPADLLDDNGEPWAMTWDQAIMLPLLELAGQHSRHIPDVLYHYNTINPASDHNTRAEEQAATCYRVRRRPVKRPLEARP